MHSGRSSRREWYPISRDFSKSRKSVIASQQVGVWSRQLFHIHDVRGSVTKVVPRKDSLAVIIETAGSVPAKASGSSSFKSPIL